MKCGDQKFFHTSSFHLVSCRFTGGRVGRITGLDPSGPLFHSVGAADRLDPTDGQFVDVIHTAGKWVGNDDISGHVDFFPNGGRGK